MFPKARYLIVASRLHPGVDGGYTVAVMRRARHFEEDGGVRPLLLTVDFSPEYPEHLNGFRRIGLAYPETILRNLYEDARKNPHWLWGRVPALRPENTSAPGLISSTDHDSAGVPWRTVWSDPAAHDGTGEVVFTDYLDRTGRLLLRTPYLPRPDWHFSMDPITVFRDGETVGAFSGFGELYRAWLASVIAEGDPALPTFIVSETRQVGQLITALRSDRVKLVHTVHNAHTNPAGQWDPVREQLWQSWLERLREFDAVVWLTEGQHRDVARRFGETTQFAVIPHPVDQPKTPAATTRDPQAAVMLTRLAPQKQVDHAIRAFATVHRSNQHAHLDIYGDGPLRQSLAALIVGLDLTEVVRLRGYQPDAADELNRASVLIVSSRYEGQSLVSAEAFAHGCPVVAYDVSYGPAEMVENGVNGYLVPAENVPALAAAVARLLGHPERIGAFSQAAHQTAAKMSVARATSSWSDLFRRLLAEPH